MAQLLTAAAFASRQDHSSERVPSKFGRRRRALCSAVRVANEAPDGPASPRWGSSNLPKEEAHRPWRGRAHVGRRRRFETFMQSQFRDDPQHWRWCAQEARIHAELIIDPESKLTLLEIADEYEGIAQSAKEGIRACERRPPASSLGRASSVRRKRWF